MIVELSTELLAPADRVWSAVRRSDTFRHVTKGVLGFRVPGGLPPTLREGESVTGRLMLFHVLPLWRHEIRVESVDDRELVIQTREHGGPLRRWDHRISVRQSMGPRSLYTDRVDIGGGPLAPPTWVFVQVFFRYRQYRWRGLARTLGGR